MFFHIVRIKGGLGNQMFQYAFYLVLKRKMPWIVFGVEFDGCKYHHYGYELDKIFDISTKLQGCIAECLLKLNSHGMINIHECKELEQNYWTFSEDMLKIRLKPMQYIGYFQTEKYFQKIQDKVRRHFSFKEEILNEQTMNLAAELKMTANTFSIHIRRGDYLKLQETQTVFLDYYVRAFNYLNEHVLHNHGNGYVFSDDVEWARENVNIYDNLTFVDWNKGDDSWQDMYLMSLCKHNIIANSTFSWWGAWLNKNETKMVIAPKKWWANCNSEESDIIPNEWIII